MRQFALPTPARRTAGALTAAALTVSGVAAITAAASSASAALPATATLAAVSHPASAVNELTMQRAEQAISRSHQRAAVQAVTESRLQRQAQAAAQSADAIDVHKKQQAKAAKAAKDAAAKKAAAKRAAAKKAAAQQKAAAALAAARKDPQSVARSLLSEYGFGADQFGCLVQLWTGESDWNYRAANPSSGAYGIPQSLPGSKMASAGADWQTNPATQIRWGLGYIKASYGTPCGALSAWQSRYPHWY